MKSWQRYFLIIGGFLIEIASLGLVIFAFPYFFKVQTWQFRQRINPDEALVVYFNQPILDLDLEKYFKIEPAVAGTVLLDDWRRRLSFIPQNYLSPNQSYRLCLNQIHGLSLVAIDNLDFEFFVNDVFLNASITTTVSLPIIRQREPASGCNLNGPQILFGKYVDINLVRKKIWLYEDGWCRAEYQVAAYGSADKPTPRGQFRILHKQVNHFSSLSHVWMPWSMHIVGDVFLHGIPYRPDGTRLSGGYSWGCVRIPTDQAEKIYYFVDIGTPVIIQ